MSGTTVGIVREWKTDLERRSPLVPEDLGRLVAGGLAFRVEPSPHRVFPDAEFAAAGATISDDLSSCDFLIGIKEMPVERMQPGKPHLFFSHTIKGQAYNMPMLKRILEQGCSLLDYELVADDAGRRLIFFGRQAGQAGMINSLWTLGRRLRALGVANPFSALEQAKDCASLADALEQLGRVADEIEKGALPERIRPFVCGISGTGNVSQGAQEVFEALRPLRLTPEECLAGKAAENPDRAHLVVFDEESMVRRKDGGPFALQDYYDHPELYEGRFADYLDHLNVLVAGNYWDARYPRLVTRADVAKRCAAGSSPRLLVIGDVSCDPEGGIEVTLEPTYPDRPSYVYDPGRDAIDRDLAGPGLAIMACEILPTELPRDSSRVFSEALSEFLPAVAGADWSRPLERLGLPAPFQRAVIAHRGELAPAWAHLL